MNVQTQLKNEGIEVVEELNTLLISSIAKNVARRIIESFPDLNLDEILLFNKIAKLNMVKAKMPSGMAEASYFYENQTIYFNYQIENEDLEEFAIHECIHHLQERLNYKQQLYRMGLCNYSNLKPYGLAINEAAVQYTASYIIGIEPDFEKYYKITLYTPSPSYYPLECALLNELIFFTGKDTLFKSTLLTTNDFKNKIIELTSQDTYDILVTNFDKLLSLEEDVVHITNQINSLKDGSSKYAKLSQKLDNTKQKIADIFFAIQNVIIEDFFNFEFKRISNIEDLENLRHKLNKFTKIIGISENYTFFDSFYAETMNKLEHKCNILENGGIETALSKTSSTTPFSLIHKLFQFIFKTNRNTNELNRLNLMRSDLFYLFIFNFCNTYSSFSLILSLSTSLI